MCLHLCIYTDLQRQFTFDNHTLVLSHSADLNAQKRLEESGQRTESFIKIIEGTKEDFTEFLQRLRSAVNRMISDPVSGLILNESLTFKNGTS